MPKGKPTLRMGRVAARKTAPKGARRTRMAETQRASHRETITQDDFADTAIAQEVSRSPRRRELLEQRHGKTLGGMIEKSPQRDRLIREGTKRRHRR